MSTPILCYHPPAGMPTVEGQGLPSMGNWIYWPSITTLTTGDAPAGGPGYDKPVKILEEQNIGALPADAIVVVDIYGRGASQWKRVIDPSSPSTNTYNGVIVPTNYDASKNPAVLHRVAGY